MEALHRFPEVTQTVGGKVEVAARVSSHTTPQSMPDGKDGPFRNMWKRDLRLQGGLRPSPLCPSRKALYVLPEWVHVLTKETEDLPSPRGLCFIRENCSPEKF